MGLRRKPQVLSRAHYHLELLAWIHDHHIPSGNTMIQDHPPRMPNSGEIVLFVRPPYFRDEDPLRKLSLLLQLKLSGTIPRFTDSVMLPDYTHVSNVIMPQHQCELLWIVANISARQSLQSSGVIWAVEKYNV